MDIIIHSGMHKTATTSVQTVLRSLVTGFPGHYPPMFLDPVTLNPRLPSFDPTALKTSLAAAQATGWSRVFVSAEVISALQDHELSKLLDAMSGHDIRIVTCFRHWATFLPSRWQQNVKRCDTQSFGAYFRRLHALENTHIEARYDLIVERFQRAGVSRQQHVSYDHANAEGRVVQTVLDTMSAQDFGGLDARTNDTRVNVAEKAQLLDALRLFNGVRSAGAGLPLNMRFDTVHRGGRVAQFYDQTARVEQILASNADLCQRLNGIVEEAKTTMTLSSDMPAFRRWEQLLCDRALADCVNARNGRFFPEIGPREVTFADLEIDDLPADLRRAMTDAILPRLPT